MTGRRRAAEFIRDHGVEANDHAFAGPISHAAYLALSLVRGPGGAIVFYDAGSTKAWGRYLEAAPTGWSGSPNDPRVPGATTAGTR